jgi:hypothetical protein
VHPLNKDKDKVKIVSDNLLFQNYLVVFLDHLGQRKILEEISKLPTNSDEQQEFIQLIKETHGKVIVLREIFRDFFDESKKYRPNVNLIPPELQADFIALQKSEEYYYPMSDSGIIAVPLMNNDDNCKAINGVYSAFTVTSGIGLMALSCKVPLRGGLDVGIAAQIENNEIYGPGLASAYKIESEISEYPRFVIGHELIHYLKFVYNQQCTTRSGFYAKEIAKLCWQMIVRDSDGRYMLDFLGSKFKEVADEAIDSEVVKKALVFVQSQYEQFVTEKNEKLASRYYRLLNYFNSRLSVWGL